MPLTKRQVRYLRSLAHPLHPVVQIGAARVTDGVLHKVDVELEQHELIKVKIQGATREELKETAAALCAASGAELAQTIGHVLVLYRPRKKKPSIRLPSDASEPGDDPA